MENLEQQFSETLSVRQHSDPIPVDLLIDILSRVPVKSIARFRCVSKLWGSILRRPDFTELFFTKSSNHPRLFFTIEVDKELFFYSSPQPQNPDENCCVVATRYNTPFPKYVSSYISTNMVCGLVVRHGFCQKVRVICNHAMGEFLTLPKVKRKSNPKAKPDRIVDVLFGYDPTNKQFKVLCLTSSNTYMVLTLGTGKRLWRRMECDFPFKDLEFERRFCFGVNCKIHDKICINGVLYFGAGYREFSVIACFDVRSEEFAFVNFDEEMLKENSGYPSRFFLVNYKGKFGAYQIKDNYGNNMEFVLWVLEDAGNHQWSRKIYVYPRSWSEIVYEKRLDIVGVAGTGEIVWSLYELSNPLGVFFYNLERKTFARVDIHGFEEFQNIIDEKKKNYQTIIIKTFLDYVETIKLT